MGLSFLSFHDLIPLAILSLAVLTLSTILIIKICQLDRLKRKCPTCEVHNMQYREEEEGRRRDKGCQTRGVQRQERHIRFI